MGDKKVKKVPSRAPETLPDTAMVSVMLNRKTGRVTFESEYPFATPMETWGMLYTAAEQAADRLDEAQVPREDA